MGSWPATQVVVQRPAPAMPKEQAEQYILLRGTLCKVFKVMMPEEQKVSPGVCHALHASSLRDCPRLHQMRAALLEENCWCCRIESFGSTSSCPQALCLTQAFLFDCYQVSTGYSATAASSKLSLQKQSLVVHREPWQQWTLCPTYLHPFWSYQRTTPSAHCQQPPSKEHCN